MNDVKLVKDGMDKEWMELIIEAKKIGLTTEEVRRFLIHDQINKEVIVESG